MRKLWYFPLEPYRSRYTCQLSKEKEGWLESRWNQIGLNYERIEGASLNDDIRSGSVLDACGRGYWSCSQIQNFLRKLNEGEISSDDCIYLDDFWTPGIEALPYAFHLTGIKPKIFAMLHAQTVDIYDFTYPMRKWMRHFEVGQGNFFDGIFVTSTCLRDLCLYAGVGSEETVHITGLPYNSDEVRTHFPGTLPKKKNQIIFTSRWDEEKDPLFFLSVVDEILESGNDYINFLVTTSSPELRSNNPELIDKVYRYKDKYPDNFDIKINLTKEEYYHNLLESKIQFNCAHQDFVSWTLLEATTCGCIPVYPNYLSFPEALQYAYDMMYVKNDVQSAANKILQEINFGGIKYVDWIYLPYDYSWLRMLNVMQGTQQYPKKDW